MSKIIKKIMNANQEYTVLGGGSEWETHEVINQAAYDELTPAQQAEKVYMIKESGTPGTVLTAGAGIDISNNEISADMSTAVYDNTTSWATATNVQDAIDEVFQSVSNGKTLIAAAITDKGVTTAASDSFSTMATNISNIDTHDDIIDSYGSLISMWSTTTKYQIRIDTPDSNHYATTKSFCAWDWYWIIFRYITSNKSPSGWYQQWANWEALVIKDYNIISTANIDRNIWLYNLDMRVYEDTDNIYIIAYGDPSATWSYTLRTSTKFATYSKTTHAIIESSWDVPEDAQPLTITTDCLPDYSFSSSWDETYLLLTVDTDLFEDKKIQTFSYTWADQHWEVPSDWIYMFKVRWASKTNNYWWYSEWTFQLTQWDQFSIMVWWANWYTYWFGWNWYGDSQKWAWMSWVFTWSWTIANTDYLRALIIAWGAGWNSSRTSYWYWWDWGGINWMNAPQSWWNWWGQSWTEPHTFNWWNWSTDSSGSTNTYWGGWWGWWYWWNGANGRYSWWGWSWYISPTAVSWKMLVSTWTHGAWQVVIYKLS